ncbi:MAG: DNA polymerase III subunit delta [Deltaproteobacteria bacterium]|nr:DNA polymerase III subunit delta [Deltaproteobacteria bacterium]
MAGELPPEHVLGQLEKGRLSPVYLFYGHSRFRLEKVLHKIRDTYIPEGARDFNLQLFYGDDKGPDPAKVVSAIIDASRSLPFISSNRLIIVRRVEGFSSSALEGFLPYLDDPVPSTCLIFVSSKPDFRKKFYRKIRDLGLSVHFKKLYDNQVEPWIRRTAKDLGFEMDEEARAFLHQIVGNRMGELYSELEKLYLCHGKARIGLEEVKELVLHSRVYSVFELMDEISTRRVPQSLSALKRFMEEEGKDGVLRAMGMLNRQMRLLWQTKSAMEGGGRSSDVAQRLGLQGFQAGKLVRQSKNWSRDDLEEALDLLYRADGLLKSGSQENLVFENLVVSLCGKRKMPSPAQTPGSSA